jgi:hypothetical protein
MHGLDCARACVPLRESSSWTSAGGELFKSAPHPRLQLIGRAKMPCADVDPAFAHGPVGTHSCWLCPGFLDQSWVPRRIDPNQEAAVAARSYDHFVVDHEGYAAEHPHLPHIAIGKLARDSLDKVVLDS